MLKLFFDLKYQNITLTNPGVTVASDSKNYLVAKFNAISNDWETPLSAIFVSTVDKVAYTVLVGQSANLEADECFVPWEVLRDSGEVYVSVFSGNLHTTNVAKFAVVKSGYVEGEIPPPPSPTVYDIIIQAIANLRNEKQDKLIAGQNITIEGNVISASGGEASDYNSLENKPQINSYTLSGNKSSDDLGLQKKLTAGTNITLESDGTISASGGVTSYNDLTDKPKVWGDTGQYDLDKILYFPDFDLSLNGWVRQLSIKPLNYSKLENGTSYYMHENFKNSVNLNVPTLDLYGKWFCFDANNAVGLPSGIDVVISRYENQNKKVVWGSYRNCQVNPAFIEIELPLIEEIYWTDSNLKNHHAVRTYFKDTTNIKKFTDWTELSGGSQLVSGVVNQNGTITFTNSDGTTFTTTGTSVIGFSPVATVTQTASGATVSITDKNGTTTANISNGADGQDYVLTPQDKSDIADIVLSELPTTQGVLYGNTSN